MLVVVPVVTVAVDVGHEQDVTVLVVPVVVVPVDVGHEHEVTVVVVVAVDVAHEHDVTVVVVAGELWPHGPNLSPWRQCARSALRLTRITTKELLRERVR